MNVNKVHPGNSFEFPAEVYNQLLEMTAWWQSGGRTDILRPRGGAYDRPFETIRVKNDTGGNLPAWSVVALGEPTADLSLHLEEFLGAPILSAGLPDVDSRIAITTMAIPKDTVGRAVVVGVVPVKVEVGAPGTGYQRAIAREDDVTKLDLAEAGPAQVIWCEEGTGTKWALVALSGGIVTQQGIGTCGGLATSWFAQLATSNPPFSWRQQDEDEGTSGSQNPQAKGDFCRSVLFYHDYPMYITTFFKLVGAGQALTCRAWVDNRLTAGEFCILPLFTPMLEPCPINKTPDVEPQSCGAQLLPYFPDGDLEYNCYPLVIEVTGFLGSGAAGSSSRDVPQNITGPIAPPSDENNGRIDNADVTGIYCRFGNHLGRPYYRRTDGAFFIWWNSGTGKWILSKTLSGLTSCFQTYPRDGAGPHVISYYNNSSFYTHWWEAVGAGAAGAMRSRAQRSVTIDKDHNWGSGVIGGVTTSEPPTGSYTPALINSGAILFEGDMLSVLAVCSAPANWDWATAATGAAALTVTLDGAVVAPIVTAESISGSTP